MRVTYKSEPYIVTIDAKGRYRSYQVTKERTGHVVRDKKLIQAVANNARRIDVDD